MILIITITVITFAAGYFLNKQDEDTQSFSTDCLMGLILFGIMMIPALIVMSVLKHFNIYQEYRVLVIALPLLILGFFAIWATWGDSKSDGGADDKKDDFTSEAIVLTTVLSEDDTSKDSNHSNSSGSSSSSSSSNSDDFFIL